jgi:hypothetical protein
MTIEEVVMRLDVLEKQMLSILISGGQENQDREENHEEGSS